MNKKVPEITESVDMLKSMRQQKIHSLSDCATAQQIDLF